MKTLTSSELKSKLQICIITYMEEKTMVKTANKAEAPKAAEAPVVEKKAAEVKAAPAAAKKPAAKKAPAKKPAAKKAPAAKKPAAKKPAAKKAPAKKAAAKKAPAKKLGKNIFEFDGQQIDYKAIEKKAAKLGGDVYVVAGEKKISDAEGKSVELF